MQRAGIGRRRGAGLAGAALLGTAGLIGIEEVVTVRLRTFAEDTVWEERIQVQVAPGTSRPIRRWGKRELGGSPDRYLSVRSPKGTFRPNRYFFAAIKDLSRTPVRPEAAITSAGDHELRVHLLSREYAYFVNLSVPDEATRFDDNYFDLESGESRTVIVTNSRMVLAPDMLKVSWH